MFGRTVFRVESHKVMAMVANTRIYYYVGTTQIAEVGRPKQMIEREDIPMGYRIFKSTHGLSGLIINNGRIWNVVELCYQSRSDRFGFHLRLWLLLVITELVELVAFFECHQRLKVADIDSARTRDIIKSSSTIDTTIGNDVSWRTKSWTWLMGKISLKSDFLSWKEVMQTYQMKETNPNMKNKHRRNKTRSFLLVFPKT